jgi:hypothetical protein
VTGPYDPNDPEEKEAAAEAAKKAQDILRWEQEQDD